MPLVPFFQCGIVSMSCISFFSQFSALWPLYISSFPLCVNTLFHLLFLFALPALLPSPHIFCSLHQYLLFSHYLQRGILCWSCLSRAQLGLLPPSHPFGSPFVTTLPLWGRVCWFTFSSQQRHMILVQCTGCFQSCLTRVGSQPRAGRTLPMFLEREKQQQWYQR